MPHTLKSSDWFGVDGFPIAVERRDPQEPFPPHNHEFSEIVIVTGGRGLHVLSGGGGWTLSAGDVFVLGGPRVHGYESLEDLRLINILYEPQKLVIEQADLARLPGYHAMFALEPRWRLRHQFKSRLRLAPRDLGVAVALADQLDAELKRRAPGFGYLSTAMFMQIIGFLSRSYGNLRNADSRRLLQIGSAIAHLESNLQNAMNLDDLANIAHMSKRSLTRAFHEATGLSPIAYLIQLRVNRAATLLRTTDDSITDIAFRVGFTDSNYFTRQFCHLTGVSPRRYRQKQTRVLA
jgi:AraC-like DNA-binding protein